MQYFYHNMVRKYVVAFAHMFSDVKVQRRETNGTLLEEVKVPIIYATKKKMYYEIKQHPQDAPLAIVNTYLPRMGFFISGMQYDSMRKFNNTIEFKFEDGSRLGYPGVPYNFTFELSVLTKNQDDMYQILEQICVLFTPDRTVTIKELNGIERDVSINLDAVNMSSIYEYGEDEERTVSVDLTFTLKGQFYPRIQTESDKLIHEVITQYSLNEDLDPISMTVSVSQDTFDSDVIKTFLYYPEDGISYVPPQPEPVVSLPIGNAEIGVSFIIN